MCTGGSDSRDEGEQGQCLTSGGVTEGQSVAPTSDPPTSQLAAELEGLAAGGSIQGAAGAETARGGVSEAGAPIPPMGFVLLSQNNEKQRTYGQYDTDLGRGPASHPEIPISSENPSSTLISASSDPSATACRCADCGAEVPPGLILPCSSCGSRRRLIVGPPDPPIEPVVATLGCLTAQSGGCFFIPETSRVLPGWGCCRCRTYNGLQREACRGCGHQPERPIVVPEGVRRCEGCGFGFGEGQEGPCPVCYPHPAGCGAFLPDAERVAPPVPTLMDEIDGRRLRQTRWSVLRLNLEQAASQCRCTVSEFSAAEMGRPVSPELSAQALLERLWAANGVRGHSLLGPPPAEPPVDPPATVYGYRRAVAGDPAAFERLPSPVPDLTPASLLNGSRPAAVLELRMVTVRYQDGTTSEAAALVVGPLAAVEADDGTWRLTRVASGAGLAEFEFWVDCVAAAVLLAGEDWSGTDEELVARPELKAAVERVLESVWAWSEANTVVEPVAAPTETVDPDLVAALKASLGIANKHGGRH